MSDTNAKTHKRGGWLAQAGYQAAVGCAVVGGLFSAVVIVLMVLNLTTAADMRASAQVAEDKRTLYENPGNDALRLEVRDLDLVLRKKFFAQLDLTAQGGWLLLGGLAVFVVGLKFAVTLRKELPMPKRETSLHAEAARGASRARWAVGAVAALLVVGAAALAVSSLRILSGDLLVTPEPEAIQPRPELGPPPSPEEFKKSWPRFRGPGGLGVSAFTNVPASWNGATGEGILWKAKVPLAAPNSPIVFGDRILCSGAAKEEEGVRLEVYCFDAGEGKLLWTKAVQFAPPAGTELPEVMKSTGYAAATMATDGQRAFAIFATGTLLCTDFAGTEVWQKELGVPDNSYGHASSLVTHGKLLLVLYDQAMPEDKKSKLIALEGATGKVVWETPREMPHTWSTPIVIDTGKREEIVVCGDPWLIAYDSAAGGELWRAEILGGEIAPSPVYAGGLVLVAQSGSYGAAIRPGGQGNVTDTNIVWKSDEGLPDVCSPVANDKFVFYLGSGGLLTCHDLKNGSVVWEKDFEVACSSSPSLAGDKLYATTEKGVTHILAAGPELKELGTAELGERVRAVPAFQDGRIYIRGEKHLFCIGKK